MLILAMVFNMEYHLHDILQVHQRSLESNGLRLELSQTAMLISCDLLIKVRHANSIQCFCIVPSIGLQCRGNSRPVTSACSPVSP